VRAATISNVGIAEYVPQLTYLVALGVAATGVATWAIRRDPS